MRTSLHLLATLLLLAPLAACSSEGGAASSGSSGTSGTPGGGACLNPSTFDYAVPQRGEADGTFLVYKATTDGTTIFLSTIESVFALETPSNNLRSIYNKPLSIVPKHYVRASDLVVTHGKTILSIPKAGGAPTPLPEWGKTPQATLAGTADIAVDGNTAFAKEATGTYYSHDLTTGAETVLGTEARAKNASFVLGPDAIYSYYPNDESPTPPTTVWKLPRAGGAITPLALTASPSPRVFPMHFADGNLFLFATGNAPDYQGAVLKSAPEGGAVTPVGSTRFFATFKGQVTMFPAEGGHVIEIVNELYYLPTGSTQAKLVACIDGDFTLHGSAAVGRTIYANVVNGNANTGGIIKIAIP